MGLRTEPVSGRCLLMSNYRPADRRGRPQEGDPRMAAPRTSTGKTRACAAATAALAAAGSAAMLFTGSPAVAAGLASGPSRSVVVTGASEAELTARITAVGGKVTGHFDLI